jgi:hypothetical protein
MNRFSLVFMFLLTGCMSPDGGDLDDLAAATGVNNPGNSTLARRMVLQDRAINFLTPKRKDQPVGSIECSPEIMYPDIQQDEIVKFTLTVGHVLKCLRTTELTYEACLSSLMTRWTEIKRKEAQVISNKGLGKAVECHGELDEWFDPARGLKGAYFLDGAPVTTDDKLKRFLAFPSIPVGWVVNPEWFLLFCGSVHGCPGNPLNPSDPTGDGSGAPSGGDK